MQDTYLSHMDTWFKVMDNQKQALISEIFFLKKEVFLKEQLLTECVNHMEEQKLLVEKYKKDVKF